MRKAKYFLEVILKMELMVKYLWKSLEEFSYEVISHIAKNNMKGVYTFSFVDL